METSLTAHVGVIIVQCKLIICRVIYPDFRFLLRKNIVVYYSGELKYKNYFINIEIRIIYVIKSLYMFREMLMN